MEIKDAKLNSTTTKEGNPAGLLRQIITGCGSSTTNFSAWKGKVRAEWRFPEFKYSHSLDYKVLEQELSAPHLNVLFEENNWKPKHDLKSVGLAVAFLLDELVSQKLVNSLCATLKRLHDDIPANTDELDLDESSKKTLRLVLMGFNQPAHLKELLQQNAKEYPEVLMRFSLYLHHVVFPGNDFKKAGVNILKQEIESEVKNCESYPAKVLYDIISEGLENGEKEKVLHFWATLYDKESECYKLVTGYWNTPRGSSESLKKDLQRNYGSARGSNLSENIHKGIPLFGQFFSAETDSNKSLGAASVFSRHWDKYYKQKKVKASTDTNAEQKPQFDHWGSKLANSSFSASKDDPNPGLTDDSSISGNETPESDISMAATPPNVASLTAPAGSIPASHSGKSASAASNEKNAESSASSVVNYTFQQINFFNYGTHPAQFNRGTQSSTTAMENPGFQQFVRGVGGHSPQRRTVGVKDPLPTLPPPVRENDENDILQSVSRVQSIPRESPATPVKGKSSSPRHVLAEKADNTNLERPMQKKHKVSSPISNSRVKRSRGSPDSTYF